MGDVEDIYRTQCQAVVITFQLYLLHRSIHFRKYKKYLNSDKIVPWGTAGIRVKIKQIHQKGMNYGLHISDMHLRNLGIQADPVMIHYPLETTQDFYLCASSELQW